MRVIYLIGPYRSDTEYGVHRNIQEAERQAAEIWRLGAFCFCPHKNTAYLGGVVPDETFLQGDLEFMRRCDAVYVGENADRSLGGQAELAEARHIGLPIIWSMAGVYHWVRGEPAPPCEAPATPGSAYVPMKCSKPIAVLPGEGI